MSWKSYWLRSAAVEYLKRWIETPYSWGGDDFSSFDCSGLVIEVLQSVGILNHGVDMTAHALYLLFRDKEVAIGKAGCLVFWFIDNTASHVEMMVDDFHVVGASGGNSKVKTIQDAIRVNAFVKQRPLNYRGNAYKLIDPFK